jgi:hypothetical protein
MMPKAPGMADAALVIALVLAGCGGTPGTTQVVSTMQLTSSAFAEGEPIPLVIHATAGQPFRRR